MGRIEQAGQISPRRQHILRMPDAEERRIAVALEAAQIGVFEFEPQTGRAFWDERIRELWGVPAGEEITYETVIAQVHPDDRALHDEQTAQAIDPTGDGHIDMEYRLLPREGKPMRWIHAIADCHFVDGRAMRLVGTVQDVTDRRSSEERTKLLMRELEHRVKNTLTTIIAVVKMSGRTATDIASYARTIEDRLRSLANSHELLRSNDWSTVDLHQIIRQEAAGFLDGSNDRLQLSGDPATVDANSVLIVTMAVHELLTNAVKYGALGPGGGQVSVRSQVRDGTAHLIWEETLSRPIENPASLPAGFGSLLLRQIMPAELRGEATFEQRPEGIRFEIRFPMGRDTKPPVTSHPAL